MGLGWVLASMLWGAAEASIFFIVPDVVLTAACLRLGAKRALLLAALAAFAAVCAGYLLWRWGAADAAAARGLLLQIPALGPDLIERVRSEMTGSWPWHLLAGSVTGVPFKIYAVEAGALGIGAGGFLAVGLVARFLRFAFTIGLTALGLALLTRLGLRHWAGRLLALAWIGVYAVYFTWRAGGI
jgi:membrane protein YqaA with SNARE-associated domain